MHNYNLLTSYGENIDETSPLNEYPRPQLKRESYLCLNGMWKYEINKNGQIPSKFFHDILVPFPLESYLSKVNRKLHKDEFLFYEKRFVINKSYKQKLILLHFGAVDQICDVYLNNTLLGSHKGGYLPFEFEISKHVKFDKENVLIVRVIDKLSCDYPFGKQSHKRGGMWYTPISGIWQTVWIEAVDENYISKLTITPDIDNSHVGIAINSKCVDLTLKILENNKVIFNGKTGNGYFKVDISNPHLWTPDDPFLYQIEISNKYDSVKSYFAMRKISSNGKYLCLNNKPYFFNGVLDQGYFSDGIYTPASYEAYKDDIIKLKQMGFNTLRKHIKVEPMMFYYYCDTLGMIVFQDMVNNGKYSFLLDTALPTIGIKQELLNKKVSSKQKEIFIESVKEIVNYFYNVPSILYYTIFNEGWGQFEADKLYEILTSIDKTRIVDSTSGWFKQNKSDVDSLHIYFKQIKVKYEKLPLIVSEFGGYSLKIENHVFNNDKEYGYKKFDSLKTLEEGFINLYEKEIIPNIKNGLNGCIYTQVSDVEDEINGIFTYDRKVCKLNPSKIKKVMDKLKIKE